MILQIYFIDDNFNFGYHHNKFCIPDKILDYLFHNFQFDYDNFYVDCY